MKKRLLSMLLVVCIVFSLMPAAFAVEENDEAGDDLVYLDEEAIAALQSEDAAEDPAVASEPDAAEPETVTETDELVVTPVLAGPPAVTRAKWLSDLVAAYELGSEVEDDSLPDNYYPDLEESHAYYRDILVAVHFGLVEIEPGEKLEPDGALTRDFAAFSLNQLVGRHVDSSAYTFSDSADVAHPDAAQAAVDQGWLALSGGKFLPNQAVTAAEASAMVQAAKDAYAATRVDEQKDDIVFKSYVKVVPNGTEADEPDPGTVTITDCPISIAAGDTVAVYVSAIPSIYRVETVSVSDHVTTLTGTPVTLSDATDSLDIEGSFSVPLENMVPAEGSEVYYILKSGARTKSRALAKANSLQLGQVKGETEIPLGNGMSAVLSFTMDAPTVTYQLNHRNGFVYLDDKNTTLTLTVSQNYNDAFEIPTQIALGEYRVPGFGAVGLYAYLKLEGSATATVIGSFHAGVRYEGTNVSAPIGFNKRAMTITAEAKVDAGFKAEAKATLLGDKLFKGNVYAKIGACMEYVSVSRTNGPPHRCVGTDQYLYAKGGYNASILGKSYSKDFNLFDLSAYRAVHHYEDGALVPRCTIDRDFSKYFTGPGSRNYLNGGWGGWNGLAYGADWEPIEVYQYTTDDVGNATITGFYGNVSALTIPSEIDGHKVIAIGSNVFQNLSQIRAVTMPDSITSIGDYAFENCVNLGVIRLPKQLGYLGIRAFGGCTSLTSVEIPKSLETAFTTTNPNRHTRGPFQDCSALKKVRFESGVKTIGAHLFAGCTGLETIVIPDTVTSIGECAFNSCTNLKEVSIPDGCTMINSSAFSYCVSLEKIVIPNSVTEIYSEAFAGCESLAEVRLSRSLTYLGVRAFADCTALTSIEIPKSLEVAYTTPRPNEHARGPFQDCSALKDVRFESGVTTVATHLFAGCTGLETVVIPNTVTSIGECAFNGCTNLKMVTISNSCTTINSSAFADCVSLDKIVIPDSVTEIYSEAFAGCKSLAEVQLSKRLTYLGVRAFADCTALTSIEIPKSLEVAYTTPRPNEHARGPFQDCSALKEVRFESGVKTVATHLFAGCTGLETIVIPNTVTSIGECAFNSCTSLKKVTISGDQCKLINASAFADCTALEEISVGEGLDSIGAEVFQNCSSLKRITLPDTLTYLTNYLFQNCSSMTEIKLPKTITQIPKYCFDGCSSLKKLELPSGVTEIGEYAFRGNTALKEIQWGSSLNTIGRYAFENSGMVSIAVPNTVTNIGEAAFWNSDQLKSIVIPNSVTSMGAYVLEDCDLLTDVTLGTGLKSIPNATFKHCDALAKVVVPYQAASIEANAFKDCVKFTEITIPRATTSIDASAFSYPAQLTIYGVAGTTAETYANEIGATFVAIDKPMQSIALNQSTLTMNRGETVRLLPTFTPADFTDAVAWKSSDTSVATVDSDGNVKAVNVGTATISLVGGDCKATCKVTVIQPVTEIWLNKTSYSMEGGQTFQLTATVKPDNAANQDVVWSTSDDTIATVTDTGLVTALKKGSAVITCAAQDGSGVTKTCTITVTNNLIVVTKLADFQSPHKYENDCSDIWQYTQPGQTALNVTFSTLTSVEEDSDYLYIYDKDGNEIGKYTGAALAGQTITVPGDTVKIKLVSDNVYAEYGFAVTKVNNVSADTTPLKITTQPKDTSGKVGDVVKFTIAATGDGLTYQWQYSSDNGKSWTNSSSRTTTATCTLATNRNGWLYRCIVKDSTGASLTSSTAKVTVLSGPTITTQPKDASGKVGDVVKFTVAASGSGLTYQWQYSADSGKSWTSSSSRTTSATCTLSTADRDGWLYRCIVTDSSGVSVTSATAKVIVLPAITQQPKDASGKVGDVVKFTIAATGKGLTYQWQYSTDSGKNWTNSSSKTTTATCTLTASRDGWLYRCIVKDAGGRSLTSGTARVTVTAGPTITAQPKAASGKVGDVVKFTVAASGSGLTYQWQYSTDNGKSWTNSFSKSTTATCTLSTADRDGWLYRCIVKDSSGASVISATAKVTVLPAITQQPKAASGKVGEVVKFTIAATGKGLTYQWQYSTDGGKSWTNSSSKTTTATCTLTASRDGWLYRCIVKDAHGKSLISNTARVTVASGPVITQQPKDASGKVGAKVTFTIAASGSGLTYQWQYSTDGGKTWTNSSSKSTTATCTLSTADRDGWLYRCIVTDGSGRSVISNTAKVLVLPTITQQPQATSGRAGEVVKFTIAATGKGLTYQWQYSTDGGKTWKQSSSTSTSATCTLTASRDGWLYRCIVKSSNGTSVTSNSARVTVIG